jgi:hypothetical protein
MLQLLYPLGLFAAIGVLMPILIHLWNIKSGKTLKVGSITFLGAASNQRSTSFRITDWPLLLLRSLLIGLIAFLLAEPAYHKKLANQAQAGWILVEKANFKKLWRSNRKQLDSLIVKGYEVHDFDVNFAKLVLKDTMTTFSRSANPALSYYSLLKQLDSEQGQIRKLYLYTDNRLSRFDGQLPTLNLDVIWAFLPNDNTETSWVSNTYQTNNQVFKKIVAHSSSAGTYFTSAESKTKDTALMQVDTANILIQIYQRNVSLDAGFIKAAVLALRDYTNRKIQVQNINSPKQISKQAKLLFWLSDQQPLSSEMNVLSKETMIFQYAGTKVQKVNSTIQDELGTALENSELYKRTEITTLPDQNIWIDAAGMPLLSLETNAGIKRYKFYSRFRPDWNNLAWTNGMVLFLTPLILPPAAADYAFQQNQRSLNAVNSLQPLVTKNNFKAEQTRSVQQSLSSWLWWLVFLLLILERWISYRKNVQVI